MPQSHSMTLIQCHLRQFIIIQIQSGSRTSKCAIIWSVRAHTNLSIHCQNLSRMFISCRATYGVSMAAFQSSLFIGMINMAIGEKFKILNGVRMTPTEYIMSEFSTPTSTECLLRCPEETCMGINWNSQVSKSESRNLGSTINPALPRPKNKIILSMTMSLILLFLAKSKHIQLMNRLLIKLIMIS